MFDVVRKLDRLSWDVQLLLADRERHTDSKKDERFLLMERDYKVIKRLAWAMLVGFAVAASTAIGMVWARRAGVVPADPATNKAERMGMDSVPRPPPP